MKKAATLKEYEDKFSPFKVEHDEADGKTYIYTERFSAQPNCWNLACLHCMP